jgi:putative redox protein
MISAKSITTTEKYKTVISTRDNTLIADELKSIGGGELGFTPKELLAASLASCTGITLKMYADHKGMNIRNIEVSVQFHRNEELNTTYFERTIHIEGEYSAEQAERLLNVATKCPVHKILSNTCEIKTQIA